MRIKSTYLVLSALGDTQVHTLASRFSYEHGEILEEHLEVDTATLYAFPRGTGVMCAYRGKAPQHPVIAHDGGIKGPRRY